MIFYHIFIFLLIPFALCQNKTCKTTCGTKPCNELVKKFKENRNTSVKPCDDFYEFACGNYDNKKKVPEYQRYQSTMQEMQNKIDEELIKLLESKKNGTGPTKAFDYVQKVYRSCLNEQHKKELDKMTLGKMIRTKFGDWNLLKKKNESQNEIDTWEILAGNLSNYDIHTIIKPFLWTKIDGSPANSLMIDTFQSSLEDKEEFTKRENSTALPIYRKFIMGTLEVLGIQDKKVVDDIINFETELVALSSNTNTNTTGNFTDDGIEITFAELKDRYPTIKFDLYFNQIMRDGLRGEFNDSLKIQVVNPDYLMGLEDLLNVTSVEIIKNYMMWRYVASMVKYMSKKWRDPMSEMYKELYGSDEGMSSTNVTCMLFVREKLWLPLAHEFLKTYFTEEDRKLVEEMREHLKVALQFEISDAEWLDLETTQLALEKLEKMKSNIGYPDKIKDKNEINRPFENMSISEDFLINAMRVHKMVFLEDLYRIKDNRELPWARYSVEVNAFYDLYTNTVILPAAISHFPLLVRDAPDATNYGSYGSAIGHEMTHGYDHQGKGFNEYGVPKKWWDNLTATKYANRTNCFVEQYGNETEVLSGKNVDGTLTLGENIADNGALRIAWMAYKEKLKTSQNRPNLKGMEDYTSDQLFFIAYANNFCQVNTKIGVEHYLKTNPHTPGGSRINIPLKNFEAFADTFGCPMDAPMRLNEDEICRIW